MVAISVFIFFILCSLLILSLVQTKSKPKVEPTQAKPLNTSEKHVLELIKLDTLFGRYSNSDRTPPKKGENNGSRGLHL